MSTNTQTLRIEPVGENSLRETARAATSYSQRYSVQSMERAISQVHPLLRMGDTTVFSLSVKRLERLVVVHEFKIVPIGRLDTRALVQAICQLVRIEYNFHVYGVVFIERGSLPRDAEGAKLRYLCRQKFVSGELAVVADWCEGPQYRQSFQLLKRDMEALLRDVRYRTGLSD